MNRLQRIRIASVGIVVVLAVTGCEPRNAKKDPSGAVAQTGNPGQAPSPTPAEVFVPPAPSESAHDPRVAAAASSTEAIGRSLETIRRRLQDVKVAFETKAETEQDLQAVAAKLKPLIDAAREDCDLVMRTAKDVLVQLPFAASGYEHAAKSYRERAEGYTDQDLKELTIRLADEFARLAEDIPRRTEMTENFIARLLEVQEFLAETDRCLDDTTTALAIFSAGKTAPEVSVEGKVFRKRLEQFIEIVFEYQETLLGKPKAVVPEPPKVEPKEPESQEPSRMTITTEAESDSTPSKEAASESEPKATAWKPNRGTPRGTPIFEQIPKTRPSTEVPRQKPRVTFPIVRAASLQVARRRLEPGAVLTGEVVNPAASFRGDAEFRIERWDVEAVEGVLSIDQGSVQLIRGLLGHLSDDGKTVHLRSVYWTGPIRPEPAEYFLSVNPHEAILAGAWQTQNHSGTIRLDQIR